MSTESTFKQLNKALTTYFHTIDANINLKIIDIFNLGLVIIAVFQVVFMTLIRDTFPFNAFLSGFICCVSQFVLNVCLRLQMVENFQVVDDSNVLVNPVSDVKKNIALSNEKNNLKKPVSVVAKAESTNQKNKISEKRAFAEYVLASLIMHFVCLHFIN